MSKQRGVDCPNNKEKVLILGLPLDSDVKNIIWSTCHVLITWGGLHLFTNLDDFHGGHSSSVSHIEFSELLSCNGEKRNPNNSMILEENWTEGAYPRDIGQLILNLDHLNAETVSCLCRYCGESCFSAYSNILDLKQGEPSKLLRELMHGPRGRPGKYSPAVQFHTQLLSMILEDLGEDSEAITQKNGKNSWLHALQKCASRSQSVLKKLKLDLFGREADDYDSLDSSQRIRLLVFLCDEVFCTAHVRSWIDDQNLKIIQNVKETKEKNLAAKPKEKQLKQKMLDEVAKAIIVKNGAPLSISEYEAVVLQIKTEVAQARTEIMESQDMVPNGIKGSAAVRTEPILLDINGCTYWKLNGYSDNSNVLLQDVGTSDAVESSEKWFTFDVEQERKIEEYISSRSVSKGKEGHGLESLLMDCHLIISKSRPGFSQCNQGGHEMIRRLLAAPFSL